MKIIAFSVFFLLLYPQTILANKCQSKPSLAAMDSSFLSYLGQQTQSRKGKIAIMPFFDNHVGNPDDIIYYGVPFLIYEIFSPANPHIIHPYLSFATISKLGISKEKLIDKEAVKQVAEKLNANYVVFGNYQHSFAKTVRVMINVYDKSKNKFLAPAVEYSTDVDDSFFDLMKINVVLAFKKLTKHKVLKSPSYTAPTMKAFRFYSKGLPLADSYNKSDLELAALWFEKGLKENYHKYDDAALALARVHFMIALIQKLNGNDYSQHWTNGQKTLSYAKYRYNKMPIKYKISHRYIENQSFAVQALAAYVVKNYSRANQHAASGLKAVPEDGVLQTIYRVTLGKNKPINNIGINNPICF